MSMRYVEDMGPDLFQEVERQLLKDLKHYGVSGGGLQIEWWNACGEGHCTVALGGSLEEVSEIVVLDEEHNIVAKGWIDFIHGGGDNPLYVFWLFLSICVEGEWHEVKDKPVIPKHLWDRLSKKIRRLCVLDDRWRRDPYVREWLANHCYAFAKT